MIKAANARYDLVNIMAIISGTKKPKNLDPRKETLRAPGPGRSTLERNPQPPIQSPSGSIKYCEPRGLLEQLVYNLGNRSQSEKLDNPHNQRAALWDSLLPPTHNIKGVGIKSPRDERHSPNPLRISTISPQM